MIRESLASLLESIAKKHNIESALDLMIAEARECIHIFYGEADEPAEIGASRLGGDPDLPASIEWPKGVTPEFPEYALANFIAQIRFSDLPKIEDFPLPSEGHLWLFLNFVPDRGPDLGFTTFFQRSPGALQPRRQTEYVEWPIGAIGSSPLRFEVGVTLPFGSIAFREALDDKIGDRNVGWDDIAEELEPEDVGGQIGGFTVSYGGDDPARTSAMHHLGRLDLSNKHSCYTWDTMAQLEHSMARVPRYIEDDEQLAKWKKSFDPYRPGVQWIEQHLPEILSWRLLIKLNPNLRADFDMGDSWPLWVFGRPEDFAEGNFSNVAATWGR